MIRRLTFFFLLTFVSNFDTTIRAESRNFRNKDGNVIEAEMLEVTSEGDVHTVRIRRISDQREFIIPILTLSLDDQQFLANYLRASRGESSDWKQLTIHTISEGDAVEIVGMVTTVTRVGALEHHALLPIGAWVRVRLSQFDIGSENKKLEFLLPFDGKTKHWTLDASNGKLFLTPRGGERKIVGFYLPRTDGDVVVRELNRENNLAETVAIYADSTANISLVSSLNRPYSLSGNMLTRRKESQRFPKDELRALSVPIFADQVSLVSTFPKLEAAVIRTYKPPNGDTLAKEEIFPILPSIQYLSIFSPCGKTNWQETLEGMPRLKGIRLQFPRSSQDPITIPHLGRIRSLESLEISGPILASPSSISQLPKLRSLAFSSTLVNSSDSGELLDLTNLDSLLNLRVFSSQISDELLDRWADSGNLDQLLKYQGYYLPQFPQKAKLEQLWISSSSGRSVSNFSRLSSFVSELSVLGLPEMTQNDLESLGAISDLTALRHLYLTRGDFSDLTPLMRFPNLKTLEIISLKGSLEGIDLADFPGLEFLHLVDVENLREIRSLSHSSALNYLRVSSCKKLITLGEPAANEALHRVILSRCDMLTDLTGLSKATILDFVSIYECNDLHAPLPIGDVGGTTPAYFSIKKCKNIEDRLDN